MICVLLSTVKLVALTVPNLTTVVPVKFVPARTTVVPAPPWSGVTESMWGGPWMVRA